MKELRITFEPSGRAVYVLPGTKLLEAAGRAGITLDTPCGGRGTCGKCRVRVRRGSTGPAPLPGRALSAEDIAAGYRLACQSAADSECVVEIPEESLFEHRPQVLMTDSGHSTEPDPLVARKTFQLQPPDQDDAASDLDRLLGAVGPDIRVPVSLLREIPRFLRANNWGGTAVLSDHTLVGLEPGKAAHELLAVAFDLGTTTIVGTLLDLRSGRERAVASCLNAQIPFGDDVISRIMRIRERAGSLSELQQAAAGSMNRLIDEMILTAGSRRSDILEISVAGNSTMQQILCGCDPSPLGEVPFVQAFTSPQEIPASELGISVHPGARAFIFPQIGGFVGGDTVAGMLAAALDCCEEPVLFIDIGTNGEIVLAHQGRFLAASTAAGPAFEGARIRQGMRAAAGAIEKVMIDGDVVFNVIGNVKPGGLCGTALIDTAAELLRVGALDPTGRILRADETPHLPDAVRRRLVTDGDETRFVLVPAKASAAGDAICLWQHDIRELQLASGAIRAGARILMKQAGVTPCDLGAVLLAGAFGNFIRRNHAQRIGMLPPVPCHRIRFIGNAASLGAKLVLLSRAQRVRALGLARASAHVDLSRDTQFQTEFAEAMLFPEPGAAPCDSQAAG